MASTNVLERSGGSGPISLNKTKLLLNSFSELVSLSSLTTFIHPVFSVYQVYCSLQIFKWLPLRNQDKLFGRMIDRSAS